jgi:molybdopterin synthase catalytic subunit/molybdopterin converting factor small subunit
MRLRVKLFGALAERAGGSQDDLDLAEPATAADVLRAVGERHPSTGGILGRVSVAVNREVVPAEHRVASDDEVALLPPVSGGAARITVGLAERPSIEAALAEVASPEAGGTVAFVGTVRADRGSVERLAYSAYREMAEEVLREVAEEAAAKWPVEGVAIVHGLGELVVGDVTVVVACAAPHRGDAFEACRYAIDEVKRRAPIWKKESGPGGERWVGLEPSG